jgi:hypothetical protein
MTDIYQNLARAIAALTESGNIVSISVNVTRLDDEDAPSVGGEAPGGAAAFAEGESGRFEQRNGEKPGAFVIRRREPLPAFFIEQRVRVKASGSEGMVVALTHYMNAAPSFLVRWNDNELRQREDWHSEEDLVAL